MSNWFRSYGFADIQRNLLVGAYPLDREDVGMLEWMKVKRVLNLTEDDEYPPGERAQVEEALAAAGIEEHRESFTDYGRLPAAQLEHAVEVVIDWLDEDCRVYVHCRAGWQRSAAVAAAVVALTEGVGIDEALEIVHIRKPSAAPLPQQREDLLRWWTERALDEDELEEDDAAAGDDAVVEDDAAADHPAVAGDGAAENDTAIVQYDAPEVDDARDEETRELLQWLDELDPAGRAERAEKKAAGEAEG